MIDLDILRDDIENIISETHDIDVQDKHYAHNIVEYLLENDYLRTDDTITVRREEFNRLMHAVEMYHSDDVEFCENFRKDAAALLVESGA